MLKKPQVKRALGLGNTALDEGIKRGEIPPPVNPTESTTARRWFEDEIIAYQEERAAARFNPKPTKKGK
jgi:predicted DNA-binding transcriptional regulator AlpA